MLTLGIETSGWDGSVALMEDQATLGNILLPREGRRHAQMLVPKIGELVQSCDFELSDLDQIAVSVGPGSFTGLRVGVVCAKTLAYALKCSLCPVMTLDAASKMVPDWNQSKNLSVIADAQRQEIYLAEFTWVDTQWVRKGEVSIIPIETWLSRIANETLVAGPGIKRHFEVISQTENTIVLDEAFWNPNASIVALCGQQAPENMVSPMELEPFYLRPSAAEEKWNQESAT